MFGFNKLMSYIWVALTFDFRPVFRLGLMSWYSVIFNQFSPTTVFLKTQIVSSTLKFENVQSEFIHLWFSFNSKRYIFLNYQGKNLESPIQYRRFVLAWKPFVTAFKRHGRRLCPLRFFCVPTNTFGSRRTRRGTSNNKVIIVIVKRTIYYRVNYACHRELRRHNIYICIYLIFFYPNRYRLYEFLFCATNIHSVS